MYSTSKGILLVDFVPPGATVNAAAYCDTLTRLGPAIQYKRRGMLWRGVRLFHDNARPNSTHDTTRLLEKFKWDLLDHPPYSPELVSSDFHLFLHLKKHLAGKKFNYDDEVKKKPWRGSKCRRQTSMTRGYRSTFHGLINVWTMPATVLKNKVIYRQFFYSVGFVN